MRVTRKRGMNMTEKAVLLSDIEFVEMHSDDWERIERESFEIQKQPQLNEYQQIVLERLKEMMVSFDLCNAIHRLERAEDWGYSKEPYDIAYESLNDKQRRQVVQVACQWALEQEEE